MAAEIRLEFPPRDLFSGTLSGVFTAVAKTLSIGITMPSCDKSLVLQLMLSSESRSCQLRNTHQYALKNSIRKSAVIMLSQD